MLKTLHHKTLGDLRAHARQFLAAWLILTLGVTFYGAMYPSGTGLIASIFRTYDQLAYLDFQVQFPNLAPKGVVDDLEDLAGVQAVEGRLVIESGVQLDPEHSFLTQLRLVSMPNDRPLRVNLSDIPVGRQIQADNEILLLKRFAERHNIQPGDELIVWVNGLKHRLRVSGLAFNPEYLVAGRSRELPFPSVSSFGVGWVRQSTLEQWSGISGMVNDVALRLNNSQGQIPSEKVEAARRQIEETLEDYDDAVILSRIQTASGGVIDANVNGNMPVLMSFSLLFLIGGLSITSVLLGRLVESERQRIGALRALGVTRFELVVHYLTFGLLVGLSGGLVGSVLGYFTSFLTMYPFLSNIAGGYLPGFINRPQWNFIGLGLLVVVLGATLSGAYPAWSESGVPPGIALRPPMPKSPSALSRISLHFLPLALRQALRNLLRVPGRSLGAALGVMAGAIMIFSSLAILNTTDSSFEVYYTSGRFDLRLNTGQAVRPRSLEKRIERIPGVQAAQAGLVGLVSIPRPNSTAANDFDTVAIVVDEHNPFFELTSIQGLPAFSSSDGIWIGHNTQRVLGVQVGDEITLKANDEEKQARVLGVVSYVMGSPVFVPRSLMEEWLPGHTFVANMALVRVKSGYAAQVRDQLADIPDVMAVEDYPNFVQDMRNYIEYWRQNAMIFAVFGAMLTLAVILNTVSASLHEQQTELAILRSLGVSAREIALVVTLELLLVTTLGLAIGVPLGRELGFYLTLTFNTDFYGLRTAMHPISYIAGIIGILLVVLLAEIPGLRAVQQTDLGQVSKSQSI